MQLELSYWKDKSCLSPEEWNKRNVETNSNRERVVQPFYPRFFKRLDNTNFCNLGGIVAWQFRMNPLSGRLRARVDLRGKFYKADPPLLPSPSRPLYTRIESNRCRLDRLYVLHIPNNAHIRVPICSEEVEPYRVLVRNNSL